jgi:HEAT repeat protein
LIEGLADNDLRFRALGALAELGDPGALPAIRKLFKRWLLPAFDRTQAAGALAKLGDAEGGQFLLARTRGRWTVDRAMAVEMLGEVKAEGALERLTEILKDPADLCRGAAARGLGRLKDARAVEVLAATLSERGATDDLRLDVAEGLCLLELPEARARVESALSILETSEARAELQTMLEETR